MLVGPRLHLVWLKGSLGYGSLALTWGEIQEQPQLSEKLHLEAFALSLFSPSPFFNLPTMHWAHRGADEASFLSHPFVLTQYTPSVAGSQSHVLKTTRGPMVGEAFGIRLQYSFWFNLAHPGLGAHRLGNKSLLFSSPPQPQLRAWYIGDFSKSGLWKDDCLFFTSLFHERLLRPVWCW